MFMLKLGSVTTLVVSTFSKITFNRGINREKLTKPNMTANTANTAYLGTKRFSGRAKASSLK
jgi:hypothetical protein